MQNDWVFISMPGVGILNNGKNHNHDCFGHRQKYNKPVAPISVFIDPH